MWEQYYKEEIGHSLVSAISFSDYQQDWTVDVFKSLRFLPFLNNC